MLALLFGAAFLYAIVAIGLGARLPARQRRTGGDIGRPVIVWQAMKDASRLRYLDGGGCGATKATTRA